MCAPGPKKAPTHTAAATTSPVRTLQRPHQAFVHLILASPVTQIKDRGPRKGSDSALQVASLPSQFHGVLSLCSASRDPDAQHRVHKDLQGETTVDTARSTSPLWEQRAETMRYHQGMGVLLAWPREASQA